MSLSAISFGEALIDEYADRRVVAGAPLHVAAHLAALGWDAALVTRIGDDEDGRDLLDTVRAAGIDDRYVEVDPHLPTGEVTVDLDVDGVPTFTISAPAAWDAIEGPDPLPPYDLLCFGTLPMRDPRSRKALQRMVSSGSGMRAGDANLRDPHWNAAAVRMLVGNCDLLKVSDTELPTVSDIMRTTGTPGDLTLLGPEWVCVTRGAAGATLHHREGASWMVAGREVVVVDTVGAGDSFLARLADGIVRGVDPQESLAAAADLASAIVGQRGGLPGNRTG